MPQEKGSYTVMHRYHYIIINLHQFAAPLVLIAIVSIAILSVSAAPAPKKMTEEANYQPQINVSVAISNDTSGRLLLKNGLFEGDLKISEEFIRRFYNLSSVILEGRAPNSSESGSDKKDLGNGINIMRNQRAAVRDTMLLWRGGRVPYLFSRNIPVNTRELIRRAMDHWETHTCLRFTAWYGERDYVVFDNTQTGCFSNSIGRKGGKQIINLERNNPQEHTGCEVFGKIVHEIGHAVGFWHEQSRPDRDSYVAIDLSSIEKGEESQFMRRSNSEVNSRGSAYDYGSIMHYGDTSFVRDGCEGCKSLRVTNDVAYAKQRRPTMGQENGLSIYDILQANSLYSCPRSYYGVLSGTLAIHAQYGKNLPDTDGLWNKSDPYLQITAVDRNGNSVTKNTKNIGGNLNPVWDEWVVFENSTWTQFTVRVYDSDFNADDPLSSAFMWNLVSHGVYEDRQLNCYRGYIVFDYSF